MLWIHKLCKIVINPGIYVYMYRICVYNANESGFNLKIHSDETLITNLQELMPSDRDVNYT